MKRVKKNSYSSGYRVQMQKKAPDDPLGGTHTLTRPDSQTQEPQMYQVILINDDFTPMDFVVLVLAKFFRKSNAEAQRVMLDVHQKGAGLAGIYPYEIAETKVYQVNNFGKANQHPLKCTMEPLP